jgi:hypothetical protein
MNDRNYRDEIVRLEEQIDDLAARIESCRKYILAGRIVVIAIVIGALQFNPSVVAGAVAAVLGGIVAAGSSHSTAKEATHELTAAEAKRTALIGHIDLRLVSDRDGPQ